MGLGLVGWVKPSSTRLKRHRGYLSLTVGSRGGRACTGPDGDGGGGVGGGSGSGSGGGGTAAGAVVVVVVVVGVKLETKPSEERSRFLFDCAAGDEVPYQPHRARI